MNNVAAKSGRGAVPAKEANTGRKHTTRKKPWHFALSIHTLNHGGAEQARDSVKLNLQVKFHDGLPNAGGKLASVALTSIKDFKVKNCGMCIHRRVLGPSRGKGVANTAAADAMPARCTSADGVRGRGGGPSTPESLRTLARFAHQSVPPSHDYRLWRYGRHATPEPCAASSSASALAQA